MSTSAGVIFFGVPDTDKSPLPVTVVESFNIIFLVIARFALAFSFLSSGMAIHFIYRSGNLLIIL